MIAEEMKKYFSLVDELNIKNIEVNLGGEGSDVLYQGMPLKNYDCVTFNRAYVAFEDWGFVPKYYLAIDGNDIRIMYKDLGGLIKKHKTKIYW